MHTLSWSFLPLNGITYLPGVSGPRLCESETLRDCAVFSASIGSTPTSFSATRLVSRASLTHIST